MSAGFFQPKDPAVYNNTVIPTFSDLVIKYEGVEELDKVAAINKTKNEDRLKSIYEEDMVIITADVDDGLGNITPADLHVVFNFDAGNDEVTATITKIDNLTKYHLIARLIRMLYLNLYDETVIYDKMAAEFISFTEKLKLDAATPWLTDSGDRLANFPILATPYPDNNAIPDTDNVYRNMIAHRIQTMLGYNIISNDFLWLTFEFFPASGTATHFRMRFNPTSEREREQSQEIILLISASAASGVGAQGIINQYRFLHFAGDALRVV